MNRTLTDQWLERGVLALVLGALIWGPLATGTVRARDFVVTEGLVILAALLWLVRLWVTPGLRLNWSPVCWPALVFAGYAVVRYFTAPIEFVARGELGEILICLLVFLLVVNNLSRQEPAWIIVAVLLVLAAGISLYALYQFVTKSNHVWHFIRPLQYGGRGSGTYINPNNLAGFLEMVLPLGIAAVLVGRFGTVAKIGFSYATVAILAGIGVTLSRGSWIAVGVAMLILVVVLLMQRHFRLPALLILGLMITAATIFISTSFYSKQRLEQVVESGRVNDIRFLVWKPAMRLWEENFWLGVGPGHFDWRFREYRPPDVQSRPVRVHNDYLNTVVDWGTVGGLMILSALTLAAAGACKTWRKLRQSSSDLEAGHSNRLALVLGTGIALCAILAHSAVDFNMHIPANAVLMVTLLGLLAGQYRHVSERVQVRPGMGARVLLSALILGACGWLGWQGSVMARETAIMDRMTSLPPTAKGRITLLEQAHAVDPRNFEITQQIGEIYRAQAWVGDNGYEALIQEAIPWFEKGIELNPLDPYNHLRLGMSLDWVKKFEEAQPHFDRAVKLDPNNYYIVAHMGWHYVQQHRWPEAKEWIDRSLKIKPYENSLASSYRDLINRRLQEKE